MIWTKLVLPFHFLSNWFYRWRIKPDREIAIPIGAMQKSSIVVQINVFSVWKEMALSAKIMSLFKGKANFNEDMLQRHGEDIALSEIFGEEDDFGNDLIAIERVRAARKWSFTALTSHDSKLADALEAHTVASRMLMRNLFTSPPLNMHLGRLRWPLCFLAYPMATKVPIRSMRHFLTVHVHYVFAAIRESKHPYTDDIILYLYELLFLQQKTAVALLRYFQKMADVHKNKNTTLLTIAEIDAVLSADLLFSYLKATVEKSIILLGLVHGIPNLAEKKRHNQKIRTLKEKLPPLIQGTPYADLVMDLLKSEALEDLNNFRTGLLHKKGISDLQPHRYTGVTAHDLPLRTIFAVIHEQHTKNTATLLAVLAMLADELVRLDPPKNHKLISEIKVLACESMAQRLTATATNAPDG